MAAELESSIAELFGVHYCQLVGSGTTALNVALRASGIPEGSKVLYPTFTCETALNAAIYAGFEPVFCDVSAETGNLDIDTAVSLCHKDPEIRAVIPTHLFGVPMPIEELRCRLPRSDIFILEDAAQAYGAEFNQQPVGSFGDAAIVSFGPGKTLDAGGGGVILTDSQSIFNRCRELSETLPSNDEAAATIRAEFSRDFFLLSRERNLSAAEVYLRKNELKQSHQAGFIHRLTDESRQALETQVNRAAEQFQNYQETTNAWLEKFSGLPGVTPTIHSQNMVPWRFSIQLDNRDEIYTRLTSENIPATRFFEPLHRNYEISDTSFPEAAALSDCILNFPLDLKPEQLTFICNTIIQVNDP